MATRYSTEESFNILFEHIRSAMKACEENDPQRALKLLKPLPVIVAEQCLTLNTSDIGCPFWHNVVNVLREANPVEEDYLD